MKWHDPKPTLCMIGLGYVGLPGAAIFAASGLKVTGVDLNSIVVETINSGRAHIVEANLDTLIKKVIASGHLKATTEVVPADVFAIAVPTPFKADKVPDLSYVEAATRSLAQHLVPGNLVILESTSPVGTTEQMSFWLAEMRPDLVFPHQDPGNCNIHIAHCPERILPGKVLHELVHNDRVIGGLTPTCSNKAAEFYRLVVTGECHLTNARTAELCKLSENAYRDVNIAFANELSLICERLDINIWELVELTNKHPRVDVLSPGTGVGGHCIAVDPWFIVDSAPNDAKLIKTARRINDEKPQWVANKILSAINAVDVHRPTVACLGLAYKPDVDDFRESPSVEVVSILAANPQLCVVVCEPFAETLPKELASAPVRLVSLDDALEADVVAVLTAHGAFRNFEQKLSSVKHLIDPCGILRR